MINKQDFDKLVLPFQIHPYIVMHHTAAFPMGIIQANARDDISPWLCGKYINCFYKPNKTLDICLDDKWATNDKILIKQSISLSLSLYNDLSLDYITIAKKMLACKYYVGGMYNEEFIPGKIHYGEHYFAHDYLLIGYDDEAEFFISVGYLDGQTFQRFDIPYKSFDMAIRTLKKPNISFNFWIYNPKAKFELNSERMLKGIYDYVNSIPSSKQYLCGGYFGLDAVGKLADNFAENAEAGKGVDLRHSRGIMEHKFFMRLRLSYLHQNGILINDDYLEMAEQVYKMSEKMHLLLLKYLLTRNKRYADSAVKILRETVDIESSYLTSLYNDLKTRIDL